MTNKTTDNKAPMEWTCLVYGKSKNITVGFKDKTKAENYYKDFYWNDLGNRELVDVIEKSAYDKLQAELDDLKNSYRIECNGHRDTQNQLAQIKQLLKRAESALEKIKGLTYSWVIAEHTINCKHTYNEIRVCAEQAVGCANKLEAKDK